MADLIQSMLAEARQAQRPAQGTLPTTAFVPPPSAHVHAGQLCVSHCTHAKTYTTSAGRGGPSALPPLAYTMPNHAGRSTGQMPPDVASVTFDQLVNFTVGMCLKSWTTFIWLCTYKIVQHFCPLWPGVAATNAATNAATKRRRPRGVTVASNTACTDSCTRMFPLPSKPWVTGLTHTLECSVLVGAPIAPSACRFSAARNDIGMRSTYPVYRNFCISCSKLSCWAALPNVHATVRVNFKIGI